MLHEVLLALSSGGPSPLLYPQSTEAGAGHGLLQSFLSPAEHALLQSLAHNLGDRNRNIRDHASAISSSHPSMVCRAVSAAIVSIYLANFQRRILEVEQDILREDASMVGAHNIVPLSAIVGAFDGWGRKLEWLWKLVQYIQTPTPREAQPTRSNDESCTAAKLIGHLRESTHTGYPDIEAISLDLARVAETAWLKQISAWILYGRHPTHGAGDFFITRQTAGESQTGFRYGVQDNLVPSCFVTPNTAKSILFIGRSLNHIRERQSTSTGGSSKPTAPELALLPNHLAYLSSLEFPLSSSSFSAAIGAIRLSLSQNALQNLLPLTKVLEILQILKGFFLLERGEFALALVLAADERLLSRNKAARPKQNLVNELASMTIKEGEVSAVLARTWTALTSYQSLDDEDMDEELDQAQGLIRLSIKTLDADHTSKSSLAPFNDLLLPAPTKLTLRVPSPLDLFLSASDVDTYSHIHAYLLSIRRAHLRLSKLFLLSVLRRDYRSPKAPPSQDYHNAFEVMARMRTGANSRARILRPIWAKISSAAFFLAELGEYFQGEVVKSSWSTFHGWLVPTLTDDLRSANDSLLFSAVGASGRPHSPKPTSSQSVPEPVMENFHDPETLTQAHKRFLASLQKELLLHEPTFITELRRLMTSIDHVSALMQLVNTIQRSLDPDTQNGVSIATNHLVAEEDRLLVDLKASCSKVAGGVQTLIEALRAIDAASTAERGYQGDQGLMQHDEFVPWMGGGVDRLLLKLDYGNVQI